MRIVLLRAGALGDVLLLRRAVASLRQAGHDVELVAPAAAGAALLGTGGSEVDALWPWDGPDVAALLAGDARTTALSAALQRADAVVCYTRDAGVAAAVELASSSPARGAGANARRGARVLVHDPAPPTGGPHASQWLLEPLRALGLPDPPTQPPSLEFSASERSAAEPVLAGLPAGFLALHPGSGSPAKNWPAARFVELAERLSPGRPVLLVLGPAEERWPGLDGAPAHRFVVHRSLPVRVLAAVLSRAGLFVGNDSGASHLAAASGAPTLALFGPTDPALWRPVGPRVSCLRARDARMESLGVDSVVRAARAR